MNILEVVGICGGGVGRHLKSLSKGLLDEGHEVSVAYTPHGVDDSFHQFLDSRKDSIHTLPFIVKREVSPGSDVEAIRELMRFAKLHGPFDVVHGHSAKGGVMARVAGRLLGIPTVYTPHSLLSSSPSVKKHSAILYGGVEAVLGWSATSRLIAVSKDEYDFVRRMRLLPSGRLDLIQNGIEDCDLHQAVPLDATISLVEKPLTFGSTMRFVDQKDPLNLIRAFEKICKTNPDGNFRLVVAGDGELLPDFARFVESRGLDSRVEMPGWQSDVSGFLKEIDVFVVSSLYEGFSYSIVEAMAAMRPVVSTRVYGTDETLGRVPGNVLVPPGDSDALALGMKAMLHGESGKTRERLQHIGLANHTFVSSNFRQTELTRQIIRVYGELANPSRGIRSG